MGKKGVILKVLNCFVIAVFFVSAVQFSVMAMAGDNSANTVVNAFSESKSSLNVDVRNLYVQDSTGKVVEKLKLPGKGKITVKLYKGSVKSKESRVAIKSKTFKTNADYCTVTFTDLTPADKESGWPSYSIAVYQEPEDAKDSISEYWGCSTKRIKLIEGRNLRTFVRSTPWISEVKINGKSPYGDDIVININKDKKAHFKVTVKNDNYRDSNDVERVAVQLIIGRSKNKDTAEFRTGKSWMQSKLIKKYKMDNLTYDFFPAETGTYYFYLELYEAYKETPLSKPKYKAKDQRLWQKGFIVVE